jgi:acetylornithine deacetylase/succinyl-diaminopimelate desuccinylase-like protein
MKRFVAMLVTALAIPTLAAAGEVYGKITSGGASVGEGATVAGKCGDKSYAAVPTDKTGSYHIVLAATGKCTLTVTVKGQSAEVSVLSYEDAAQADIILETKDGKLTARRK